MPVPLNAQGRSGPAPIERDLATASILSLVAQLTSALFLSMAYDAMTLFALAVPASLAIGVALQPAAQAAQPVHPVVAGRRFGGRQLGRRSPQPVRGAVVRRAPV